MQTNAGCRVLASITDQIRRSECVSSNPAIVGLIWCGKDEEPKPDPVLPEWDWVVGGADMRRGSRRIQHAKHPQGELEVGGHA